MNKGEINAGSFVRLKTEKDKNFEVHKGVEPEKIGFVLEGTFLEYVDLDDPSLKRQGLDSIEVEEVLLPKNNHLRLANKLQRRDFYHTDEDAKVVLDQMLSLIQLAK